MQISKFKTSIMEKNEMLKSIGFSDQLIKEIEDIGQRIPNVNFETISHNESRIFDISDTTGTLIVSLESSYAEDLIIKH